MNQASGGVTVFRESTTQGVEAHVPPAFAANLKYVLFTLGPEGCASSRIDVSSMRVGRFHPPPSSVRLLQYAMASVQVRVMPSLVPCQINPVTSSRTVPAPRSVNFIGLGRCIEGGVATGQRAHFRET